MIPKDNRLRMLPGALAIAALLATVSPHRAGADPGPATAAPTQDTNGAISPKDEADALHFVIAGDREVLCRPYVDPSRSGSAGDQPCPSLMLRAAAEAIQSKGAEFSFALRSLTPIGPRNGPQTDLEKTGLVFLASHPGQNYYGREMLGGRPYFTAVYPDIPAASSCIECHSHASGSTAPHPKAGDCLGAVVVRVPLEF